MSKDYLRNHEDRKKAVSEKYMETITSWAPFSGFLRKKWDEPLEPGLDLNENEAKDRIWKGISAAIEHRNKRSQIMRRWMTGAAAACVIAFVAIGVWMFMPAVDANSDRYAMVELVPEYSQEYSLPDGSVVWLEGGSCLTYRRDFAGERRVELTGNATFEVTKAEGKEFVVAVSGSEVVVKGTCFSIYQGKNLNLTLYNGAVEFIPEKGAAPIKLSPAHRLTYVAESGDIAVSGISEGLQWENGIYKFNQIELPELVDFMENRYNVKIMLSGNKKYDDLRMTGRLRYDESLDSIIARICYVFKLECAQQQGCYILSEETYSPH